jgi:hypothetical protein
MFFLQKEPVGSINLLMADFNPLNWLNIKLSAVGTTHILIADFNPL